MPILVGMRSGIFHTKKNQYVVPMKTYEVMIYPTQPIIDARTLHNDDVGCALAMVFKAADRDFIKAVGEERAAAEKPHTRFEYIQQYYLSHLPIH